MPPSPVVSVILPTYNHASFVLQALKSVFTQTFTDFEVIVINDGSPDNTHELLLPLANAGKIRYFHQANAGQAAARNRGIEAAQGAFIALLDDDDLWPSDKLVRQVALLQQDSSLVLTYGRAELIGGDGERLSEAAIKKLPLEMPPDGPSGDVYRVFLKRNYILSPGQTLVRRAALERRGEAPFDVALWGVDDYDFYLRLAKIGTFAFTPETTLLYRVHSANASRNEAQMHLNEMAFYRKHGEMARTDPEEQAAILAAWRHRRNRLSRYWLLTSLRAMKSLRFTEAAARLRTLWRLQL